MIRIFVSFLLLFIVSFGTASANPAIFGLKVGITTEKQLEEVYNANLLGTNKYSNGNMYDLPVNQIDFEGLEKTTLIFNKEKILVAVLTKFPQSKFDYLRKVLNKKYKKISQKIPFVGDKSVTYKHKETEISLRAPHLSFKLSMDYVHNEFEKMFKKISNAEKKQKENKEASQL